MDVGIVCDQCDAFNAMAASTCISCGSGLSLQASRRPAAAPGAGAPLRQSSAQAAVAARPVPAGGTPTGGTPTGVPVAVDDRAQARGSAAPASACRECGAPLSPGFRFCGSCGAPVERGAPRKPTHERRTQYFGAMQAARAKLVLIKGDGLDGVSFTLAGQDHIAGRTEGPLLFQDDPFLSPRHANFYYLDGRLHVRDEVSANGVYVRIRAPTPLRSGDTFLIGEQVIRVETTPPETAGLGPDDDGTYVFASPRRASRMRLVQLLRGGDIGLCVRAAGEVVVLGRDGNDVNFPDDPFISGRHAQVAITDQGLVLTDLGSKNGTFLRLRVGPGPGNDMPLQHGDYVFMGQQLLRVEIVS
jgi:pSer/pThr/pTyr-binding forkhead associated (FHA) protein